MGAKSYFQQFKIWGKEFSILFLFSDAVSTPKHVKNEVSGVRNCKFEFSAIKNHYMDIYDVILDKLQKSPREGDFEP